MAYWLEIWPATLCIAGGFAVGAFFGAKIVPSDPSPLIRLAFGLLLIYIGVRFVVGTGSDVRSTAVAFAVVGVSLVVWLCLSMVGKQYRPVKLADEIRKQQRDKGRFTQHE